MNRGLRGGIVGVVLLATLSAGCSETRLWTGTFRSTEARPLAGVAGMEEGVYLELVIGHFGPDLAGIIRFYRDPEFLQPVPGACPCQYLLEGRYEDGALIFAFPSPSPCSAASGTLLAARLAGTDNGDRLEGPLGMDLRTAAVWTFQRRLKAQDLTEQDKECTPEGAGGAAEPRDDGMGDLEGDR
ncbi:MAG TPA: hypothetical protein PLQ97_08025 [Myxococcota bacterium]|nr:hypothetical protein [Myxococcota bacterium]HQK50888.1 hypothetical protein [Myxococcota bacterium]